MSAINHVWVLYRVKAIIDEPADSLDRKRKKDYDSKSVKSKRAKRQSHEEGSSQSKAKSKRAIVKPEKIKKVRKHDSKESRKHVKEKSSKKDRSPAAVVPTLEVTQSAAAAPVKTLPREGSYKTRSRNARRRQLERAIARKINSTECNGNQLINAQWVKEPAAPEVMAPQVMTPLVMTPESAAQDTKEYPVPSASLLKRNRNKKRGFLEQTQKAAKEHIRFDAPATVTSVDVNDHHDIQDGGTAIITTIDLDPARARYDLRRKQEKKYPVQKAPRVVTANSQSLVDSGVEDLDGNTMIEERLDDGLIENDLPEFEQPQVNYHRHIQPESADMEEEVDYDACPVVNFTTQLPQVLDVLAIKTLVLSSTYTPEISDWREVVVKEFDIVDGTITVEHLGLTDKALRQGGRFELDRDQEQAKEPEEDDDSIVTLLKTDIVDMRRIR
ncbi:hypothetical protein VKS41_007722 [Umbelopsis sp. WA50703]